jgi:hypothetical protein
MFWFLVCQRAVEEMEKDIEKIDPKKVVEVGTYRLDHNGDQKQKLVKKTSLECFNLGSQLS